MPSAKTPHARLFVAQIRIGDPGALHQLEQALIRNAGNIEKTAGELNVAFQSLHRWGTELPAVAKLLEKHRRGRIGRGPGKPKEPGVRVTKKRSRKT